MKRSGPLLPMTRCPFRNPERAAETTFTSQIRFWGWPDTDYLRNPFESYPLLGLQRVGQPPS